MKKSLSSFYIALLFSIINWVLFGILTAPYLLSGANANTGLTVYVFSAILSVGIIYFSLSHKKNAYSGPFWLPTVMALPPVLFEIFLIIDKLDSGAQPSQPNDLAVLVVVAVFFIAVYALFRYYFYLSKRGR